MRDIYYAYTFGFRSDDIEAIARIVERRLRLGLERNHSGSRHGDYFAAGANDYRWILHRHAEREDHGTFYNPDWSEFDVLLDYDGKVPMPQFERIKDDPELGATVLERWIYDDAAEATIERERYGTGNR